MELITKIFELDLQSMVPELGNLLRSIRLWMTLAVLAGPVAMTALGALYIWRPAPEANYRFGFRTYFGMGSVEAWQYSQKMAGLIFGGLGVLLLIIMIVVVLFFGGKDPFQVAKTATGCLLWQAGLAIAARLTVAVLCAVYFDKNGDRRK